MPEEVLLTLITLTNVDRMEKKLGKGTCRRYSEKVPVEGTWRSYLEMLLGEGI